ncbi:hypothetical protein BDU57DRAFT_586480 [Ampelomyces quisqualis]|uniref:TLC domain-containing protein n=1 Tax=Ampelomyces quisqualis TaxID=50730 RepID=A0A6A5QSS9_AMPQU|nr:hypothetical protein BDU57DRAFT_586480 [Ampelomyces quisqualis]
MHPNQEVSKLAPYASLVLIVTLGFFLNRIYGDTYRKLNDNQRRGFINHHVAATAKIMMLISAAVPFLSIMSGKATLNTHAVGSKATYGDLLLVLFQVFTAMYIFELFFRAKLSIIAVCHHVGSVAMSAVAVSLAVNWENQPDATLEFIMCCLWGLFDIIAECWPHFAIILYRVYENDHKFLSKVMLSATIITLVGTIVETIVVMYFWASAWYRWTLAFKIVTPILHVVFAAAQLWGTKNFYSMWQSQKRKLQEKSDDVETGEVTSIISDNTSDKSGSRVTVKTE